MTSHRFDPVSALFAVVAIATGAAVALGVTNPVRDADVGVWLALVGVAVGLLLVPWGRRSQPQQPESDSRDVRSDLVDLDP